MIKLSTDRLIHIKLIKKDQNKVDARKLITDLIDGGWSIIYNNTISYLGVRDNGNYDWQEKQISLNDFFDIAKTKQDNDEVIGVIIRWEDSEIGGTLIIHPDLEVSFLISINTKKLKLANNEEVVDVNWYIEKLVILLKNKKYIIERFAYEEF